MNIWNKITELFFAKKEVTETINTPELNIGRQIKEWFGQDKILVSPTYSNQWLEILEELANTDPYFSKAIDNIKLGNTEYQTYFDDNISPSLTSEMQSLLNERRDKWYQGGFEALKNSLFRQIAITGTICAEIIPDSKLQSVNRIILVNPKEIQLVKTSEGTWYPTQIGEDYLTPLKEGFVYMPLETSDTSPYAIPPFISAVKANKSLNKMFDNLDSIIEKIGLGGFLSVLVARPSPYNGESPQMYQTRLERYLNDVNRRVEGGFQKGMAVGFIGDHQIGLSATNLNIANASGVLDIFKKIQFAGLKQDGNMFGEQTGITETFGRVVLAVLSKSIENPQKLVASFISKIEKYELIMNGFNPDYVRGEFSKPMIGDEAKVYQAEQIKLTNIEKKLMLGIINVQQAAQEAGYDAPADVIPLPKATTQTKTKPTKVKDDVTSERRKASLNFEIHNPYFDYEIPQIYKHNNAVLSFGNKEYEKQAKAYSEAIKGLYQSACKASAKAVQRSAKLANFVNSETFANSMLNYFIESYRKEFIEKLPSVVNGNVLSLYQTSRTDQSIFRKRTKQKFVSFAEPLPDIPLPFFSLNDYKLIEYLQGLDLFYLGKFITDEDSIKRFMIALETFYGESAGDIGKDSETIKELGNMFLNETENQTYKIRRIVETTLNKIRNYSSLYYMEQAEVQRFRIVEAMDNLTCPHCQTMNSRIFEVKTATQKIKQETNVPYSEIGNVSPFLTTQKVDDISKLSSSELQSLGYSTPPYHPLCRGIVVADI